MVILLNFRLDVRVLGVTKKVCTKLAWGLYIVSKVITSFCYVIIRITDSKW